MWQFMMGFSMGIYVGTIYDCKPTVTYVSNFLKNNIPEEAKPCSNKAQPLWIPKQGSLVSGTHSKFQKKTLCTPALAWDHVCEIRADESLFTSLI